MRIAILCEEDAVWGLPTWKKCIPLLKTRGYEVSDICLVPAPSKIKGTSSNLWFLKTLGVGVVFKLALFSAVARIASLLNHTPGFQTIAINNGINLKQVTSVNDQGFQHWLKEQNIDILIIMVSQILKDGTIDAVNTAVINKHAALLPNNRGVWPYFWARLKNEEQGITFHRVDAGIDTGEHLYQAPVDEKYCSSMISFYLQVFNSYPEMLLQSLDNLNNAPGEKMENSEGWYHSYPTKPDVKMFQQNGGNIIRWRDIFKARELWN